MKRTQILSLALAASLAAAGAGYLALRDAGAGAPAHPDVLEGSRGATPKLAPIGAGRTPAVATAQAIATDGAVSRDTTFASLVTRLSEPGGYFDSDNLISNEASYLHVIGKLDRMAVRGGAYVGVGPDQSFSYMARIQPEVAFIIDIRRDNLLEHLLFKALFHNARNRLEYLCLLLGRPVPEAVTAWTDSTVLDIVRYIDATRPDVQTFEAVRARVDSTVATFGLDLSEQDLATIARFHSAFFAGGLDLRFTSIGRAPRAYYPTLRDLILETDLEGRRASYLAIERGFQYVKDLQVRGLVVPVVGDLAGPHAMRAIGEEVRRRGLVVSALYTSNVEYYLMRDTSFDRFADNVASLPVDERSVIIRSLFQRTYLDPNAVRGYYSSQLLQTISTFVEDHAAGGYESYADLITRNPLDIRG